MTDEMLIFSYCFAGGALLLLVLLGLAVSASMPGIDKRSKRFFIASFSVLVLSIVAYVVDLLVFSNPDLASVGRVVAFFETFLPSLLMPLLTAYLLHCCQESTHKSAFFYTELALCAILLVLLGVTQFTDAIYYFTSDNQFFRGPWYPVLIAPMVALILVNLVGIIRRRRLLTKKYFVAFLIYLLPLLVVMIMQAFVSVFLFIIIGISIAALSMVTIILTDQVERYISQQQKIADQRARITVLQMRPHFIYNTMMSIYYLCEQDPEKARQVTLDFTAYLRKNFNAIAGGDLIPFSEELEHTRAYLAVVQAQFDDRLSVGYDTPHLMFRVPPLTLQPIVENAVKYGMDPDAADPLRITVRTEKTDAGSVIIVEDNGPGFREEENGEPHVALNNIRERLAAIGAALTVQPRENGGTAVRILLPNG